MKLLSFAFFALVGMNAQAAGESAEVSMSAANSSQTIQLMDQRFEPIYETQPYETTCSRQVLDHTESVCNTVSDSVCSGGGESCETVNDSVCNSSGCTNVPRRVCHTTPRSCVDVPRRVCHDQNVFRTDYYACTQYRQVVVGERLVKTFHHQIEVMIADPSILGSSTINLQLTAAENTISARMSNSFSGGLLSYETSIISESDSGSFSNRVERITVKLALSRTVLEKIGTASLERLELGRNAFRFEVKNAADIADHLSFSIRLVRNRSIFGDSTRYDGTQSAAQLGLVGQGGNIQAIVPYQKLSTESVGNNRHDLTLSIKLNPGSAPLLNAFDFQGQLDRKLEQRLSKAKPTF